MKILHVIDTLDGDGSARQLRLLAPALAQVGCAVDVCCLGTSTRQADELRRAGIAVQVLGWTRWLDATALLTLRGLVRRGGYDHLHAWRLPALRALALAAPEALPRAIVSSPLPRRGRLRWWDRRLLQRVRCVALADDTERQRCLRRGLDPIRWQPVSTLVAPEAAPVAAARRSRRIACAGRLERDRGFREAIWAVDVLRYVYPDVQLCIAGTGPAAAELHAMIERLHIDHAHLLGAAAEPAEVLASADVCWVPSLGDCGRQAALEALALGQAVIASDVPCLRALIRDGETGCLVAPGEPVALARQSRALLDDPAARARLGTAARADVHARFAAARVATRWYGLYNSLAS